MEEVIGKYYDLGNNSTNWYRIKTYIGRVKDTLSTYYDLEGCKIAVQNYFNGLFSLCYVDEPMEENNEELSNNEEVEETIEEEEVVEEESISSIPPKKEEIQTEVKEEEIINNEEEEEPTFF